jgi:germacradienol/geosmin synthase
MAARMRQFEHLVDRDLPVMFADLGLDDEAQAAIRRHVEGLQHWMAGILEWHRRCDRYTEAELRRHHRHPGTPANLLFLPTGRGTSAVWVT